MTLFGVVRTSAVKSVIKHRSVGIRIAIESEAAIRKRTAKAPIPTRIAPNVITVVRTSQKSPSLYLS